MQIEKNVEKHLIIGLIYPAILGTVIYSLMEFGFTEINKSNYAEIFANFNCINICKSLLVFSSLIFYGCDFLYTTYTKKFRRLYFFLDLIILTGLFVTFKVIKYETPQLPAINLILGCYMSFMILYLVWDGTEYYRKENKNEAKFYRAMVYWEVASFSTFGIIWVLMKMSKIADNSAMELATGAIAISTSIFIWLVRKKRDLYLIKQKSFYI